MNRQDSRASWSCSPCIRREAACSSGLTPALGDEAAESRSGRCVACAGPAGEQALEPRQLLGRGLSTAHAVTGDDFEERAALGRGRLMRRPGAMVDVGARAAGLAVLNKGAAQHEDDLVGLVVIDPAHPVARLPLDQYRALAGLRIFKEDLPARARGELERAYVPGIDVRDRFCRLNGHGDLPRVGGDNSSSRAWAAHRSRPPCAAKARPALRKEPTIDGNISATPRLSVRK